MIGKIHRSFQRVRWALDPSRWLISLLGLSKYEGNQKENGLILIQIDGLSHPHFQTAVDRGYLPFLKRLREKEHYRLLNHYSGIPSCTPTIQGELFYGVEQCVPAFKFRDPETGRIFTFYDSHAASEIESRLEKKRKGLLTDGSSYSNIFKGGADGNAHFCVASIGWQAFFKALNPYSLAVLFLFNLPRLLRMVFYVLLELILAVFDSVRGALSGYGFWDELKFILSRLVVTIGLRELATLGVKLDIARGLSVIHVNFFGYDDQAHRRGPESRFADWSLPGIDGCVKRIWKAARNSLIRDYDVWIYSDHGQENVLPYEVENGRDIEKAVEAVFCELLPGEDFKVESQFNGVKRFGCREAKFPFNVPLTLPSPPGGERVKSEGGNDLIVTAQGPLGFIYPHRPLHDEEKEALARGLVEKANIPLVLVQSGGEVHGFTKEGRFLLPEKAEEILGEHPYFEEVSKELAALVRHPDSGPFVISGWRKGGRSISFPHEYGSHAGPGTAETDGFALIPRDIRVHSEGKKYLRPLTLRHTVTGFLKGRESVFYGMDPLRPVRHNLRVMTYNVHSCIGMDGKLSPERIARVIARHDPDVVALQELDVGRTRTGGLDQAKTIARLLDMQYHFHPARVVEEEMYGNAVLSRYPLKVVFAGGLPRLFGHHYFEPRGALWVEIKYLETSVQLINTHLSFWSPEQRKQVKILCGKDWLGHPDCRENIILCGDFNASPHTLTCQSIGKKLDDAQLRIRHREPIKTWFGHWPLNRIDHIFISPDIGVAEVEVPRSRLEKLASDHLPLIAELRIHRKGSYAEGGEDHERERVGAEGNTA